MDIEEVVFGHYCRLDFDKDSYFARGYLYINGKLTYWAETPVYEPNYFAVDYAEEFLTKYLYQLKAEKQKRELEVGGEAHN